MHQETQRVCHLWRLAVQERDEAIEQLKHSLAKLSRLQEQLNTLWLSEEQQILHYYPEPTDETTYHQNYSYNNFSDDSPSPFSSASPLEFASNITSPEIHDSDCYSFRSNQMGYDVVENRRDFETVVLETIGGVLPEKGKFSQAVKNAGQLLESLFITGPVPKWRNPPVQMSSQIPVLSNNIGKWIYGGLELGPETLNRSFSGKMPRFSLMP